MSKDSHVLKRDGSGNYAEPRPNPPARPAKKPAEADAGGRFGGTYGDASYTGWRDERAAFEAASGNPSPRQRAQRGEDVGGTHDESSAQDELIRCAAPLT